MPPIEEKDVIGDLVLYEQPSYLSRDIGTILSVILTFFDIKNQL